MRVGTSSYNSRLHMAAYQPDFGHLFSAYDVKHMCGEIYIPIDLRPKQSSSALIVHLLSMSYFFCFSLLARMLANANYVSRLTRWEMYGRVLRICGFIEIGLRKIRSLYLYRNCHMRYNRVHMLFVPRAKLVFCGGKYSYTPLR